MKSKFTLLSLLFMTGVFRLLAVPMTGTYTVGGTTPDFPTLQRAIDTLTVRGVSGPVVFDIRPGTYNGQINIGGNIAGVSATNTITIESEMHDSTSVILTDTASLFTSNFVFHVFGTDYLILRHLTLYRIGTATNCTVVNFASNSKFFKMYNCVVKNDFTTGTADEQALVYFPLAAAGDSNLTFDHCVFINGSWALYLYAQSATSHYVNPQITNNVFQNQSSRVIDFNYCTNPVIENNTITSTNPAFTYNPIYLYRVLHSMQINNNTVIGVNNGDGIHLDSAACDAGTPGLVSNNFIYCEGTGTSNGIYYNEGRFVNTYNNSINLVCPGNTSGGFYISTGDTALNFRNNIVMCSAGGVPFYLTNGGTVADINSDYNDLYVTGASNLIAFNGTTYDTTLAQWQTFSGQEAHSVSDDPLFISATDLHASSTGVNNLGEHLTSVMTDIDGELRNATTPDIGADEFTPLSDNMSAIRFISPSSSQCGDSATVVAMIIKNLGQLAQTGFDVKAEITGMITTTLTETYSGSLVANAVDTVYFTSTLNTYAGGQLSIKGYTSLIGDQYNLNDTINRSFNFISHPNTPVIPSPQTVCDNAVLITGTPDSTDVLVWYDQPAGGNLLHVGNDFSPVLTTDSTFYAESRAGSGAVGCIRITETQTDDFPSGSGDYIEVSNLSGISFDATGYTVLAGESTTDINLYSTGSWHLGNFNPNEVQWSSDVTGNTNYWGINLQWNAGPTYPGWVLIIDSNHVPVDFMAFEWDSIDIANMAVFYGGDTIRPGTIWSGAGIIVCPAGSQNTVSRIGTDDNDNASDWNCEAAGPGVQNTNLSAIFANCGVGFCGSPRVPVSVILSPGINPVNLGPDTVVGNTDSLLLDAGAGYTTYLWSTGDTTQTIYAMQGTYWVSVVGGVNNCTYNDTININTPVKVYDLFNNDNVFLYPNPANNKLTVSINPVLLKDAIFRITDIEGRILQVRKPNALNGLIEFDLTSLSNGFYYLQIVSGNKSGAKKFTVAR